MGYYSPDPRKLKDDPKIGIYYNLLRDPLTEDFEGHALLRP